MINFTDRDKEFLKALADRGWSSSLYLVRFFPSHQAMLQRLKKLTEYGFIQTITANDVLGIDPEEKAKISRNNKLTSLERKKLGAEGKSYNTRDYSVETFNVTGYFAKRILFYKLSQEVYDELGLRNPHLSGKDHFIHQMYQEYIELMLYNKFSIKDINSNPNIKPCPDLLFLHNNHKYIVEIERTLKSATEVKIKKKRKDGTERTYTKKAFNYQKHIDSLLDHADKIIYYLETPKELELFKNKDIESRRLWISCLGAPEILYNYKNEKISLQDFLNE